MKSNRKTIQINHLLSKYEKSGVVFYDLAGKYGDWLFKQPIFLSFKNAGYLVFSWRHNPFAPLISCKWHDENKKSKAMGVVFSRGDMMQNEELQKILCRHRNVVEIRRLSRSKEILKLWHGSEEKFRKIFFSRHEQERISTILQFLNLPVTERRIDRIKISNKKVALNFNVDENAVERLKFRNKEICEAVKWFLKFGYEIVIIRRADVRGNGKNATHKALLKKFSKRLRIVKTSSFKKACDLIDSYSCYFGVDSGLAHHAVQKGKVVFSLYNSKYHGKNPLFNTKFSNHIVLFGDKKFSGMVKVFLTQLEEKNRKKLAKRIIKKFVNGESQSWKDGIARDGYENSNKIQRLILELCLNSETAEKKFSVAKELFRDIFLPDYIWEFDYDRLEEKEGRIFIDTLGFSKKLKSAIEYTLGGKGFLFDVVAKKSSFFYGTALKRGVSDIDLMTMFVPRLTYGQRVNLLSKVKNVLARSNFSLNFPHQVPTFEKKIVTDLGYSPIIKNGLLAFKFRVQTDDKNLEKYKSRIKIKIILNEIDSEDLERLAPAIKKSKHLGTQFLVELRELIRDRERFEAYQIFIRKMEMLLERIGGFGSKGSVALYISEKVERSFKTTLEGLMSHGIVYMNNNRLYINWDIRRPQNAWFIPIGIIWRAKQASSPDLDKVFESDPYLTGSLEILRRLNRRQIRPREAVNLLGSPSYLVILEAFHYLRSQDNGALKEKISVAQIRKFLNAKNSDCNDSLDKKVNLFHIMSNKSPKLSEQQLKKLSKYNLFVQYLNNSSNANIDLKKTKFFKEEKNQSYESSQDFSSEFISNFIRLLREYRLYRIAVRDETLMVEKKKEILFTYFVKGKNLMEGPEKQSRTVRNFLKKIEINKVFFNQKYLEELLVRFSTVRISCDVGSKFILPWAIENPTIR